MHESWPRSPMTVLACHLTKPNNSGEQMPGFQGQTDGRTAWLWIRITLLTHKGRLGLWLSACCFLDELGQWKDKQWDVTVQEQLAERLAKEADLPVVQNCKSNSLPLAWKDRREKHYLSMREWNIKAAINHQAGVDHGLQADSTWTSEIRCHGQCDNEKTHHRAAYLIKNEHCNLYFLFWLLFQAPLRFLCELFLHLLCHFYLFHYIFQSLEKCVILRTMKESLFLERVSVGCWGYTVESVMWPVFGRELQIEEEEALADWPLACQATHTADTVKLSQ